MEIDDELIFAARDAANAERAAWTVIPSPIVGSNMMFVHDMRRDERIVLFPDAPPREAFTEYRCDKDMAASIITQQVWRAGLEAAVALHNSRQKRETIL